MKLADGTVGVVIAHAQAHPALLVLRVTVTQDNSTSTIPPLLVQPLPIDGTASSDSPYATLWGVPTGEILRDALLRDATSTEVIGRVDLKPLEQMVRTLTVEMSRYHYAVTEASRTPYSPGAVVPYAGRIYDDREVTNGIEAVLDFWLTAGRFSDQFEEQFARYLGVRKAFLVNSGSSANLCALAALTSPLLGEERLKAGDEVITVAAGFPTTVAPIVQCNATPVFVDISLPTYNIDCSQLERAFSSKTRAVMIAHSLGNPFDAQAVLDFCRKHDLWLIEDNCDALGSEIRVDGAIRKTGTLGDVATSSFYPPHHLTMGEGGAVYTQSPKVARAIASMRDWGRDCWCPPGKDNTCGVRFEQQFGSLPYGYDHKYTYSHLGFNLKATDLQAAIGCAQLGKIDGFVAARRKNWADLRDLLRDLSDVFILPEPTAGSDPSWFGFMLSLREHAPFSRNALIRYLEGKRIQTRMLFGGNLVRQPCMQTIADRGGTYRVVGGELPVSDFVMNSSFWVGVYPGLTEAMLGMIAASIKEFVKDRALWNT